MTASRRTLLIRADATSQMGTGHVMRCLALAQAWQEEGGTAHFAVTEIAPALEARLSAEGMGISHLLATAGSPEDAEQSIALAQKQGAAWVMVDGYQFSADYQRAIKEADFPLLFVDDYAHAAHYHADLVLNQNIYAHETMYPNCEPNTQLLLGTDYVLLRREFWPWRSWRRELSPIAHKVLITLGGSDPGNFTGQVIAALEKVDLNHLETIVLVGGGNPHFEELRQAVRHSRLAIHLERNTSNMPELMAWADLAVSAAGSTCWELAYLGLASMVLVLAENQSVIAASLEQAGAVVNLGSATSSLQEGIATILSELLRNEAHRRRLSKASKELVDGDGCWRLLSALQ